MGPRSVLTRTGRYKLIHEAKRGYDGFVEREKDGKFILIDPNLGGKHRLEIYIHEMLHANYWDLEEEAVEEGAKHIASALWKIGYRAEDE